MEAIFGAGCFWGVEAAFRKVEGVIEVISGYCGGDLENPTYRDVCTGLTGHAECVKVTFDPSVVSYAELLETFWKIHDPTTLNRQGPDEGTQYRSAIFTLSREQEVEAEYSKKAYQKKLHKPIVTQIAPAKPFHPAEEYHQRYYEKHGIEGCGL